MMNRCLIFIVLLFLQFVYSQVKIVGKVESINKVALSYCAVGVLNSDIATLTNEKGYYEIAIPENINSADIIFEVNGFEKKIISINELKKNPNIILDEQTIRLDEVSVKNVQMKEKVIGQKKRPMLTFSKMFDGNVPTIEQGTIFEIYPKTILNAYNFYIIPSSKFEEITLKMNIYSVRDNLPYKSLISENIIYNTRTTAWQKIDLTPYKLRLNGHDKIAITLQLVQHKKIENQDFVFGISAKKVASSNMLFRYHNQGNWESSSGTFISNLEVSHGKGTKKNNTDVEENEADEKTNELISYYKYKEQARKSNFGKNKKGRYLDLIDTKIYYEEYGKGEPLILLHGNNGSIEDFYQQIPFFAKKYRVLVIDTRGQGRSADLTKEEYSYELFASDLYRFVKELNLQNINFIGWSDGGNTSLIFNYQYPELVKKLVIIGAVLDPSGVKEEIIKSFENQIKNPSEYTNERLIRLMLNQETITSENLQKINNPTLVIVGDRDIVKQEHTEKIHTSILNSELKIIPNSTHYIPFEQPKVLNETILNFLEK